VQKLLGCRRHATSGINGPAGACEGFARCLAWALLQREHRSTHERCTESDVLGQEDQNRDPGVRHVRGDVLIALDISASQYDAKKDALLRVFAL
jgi:hypothetical protein